MATAFTNDHRWDRNAFLGLVLMEWIALIMGFGPEIAQHISKQGFQYPPILHVHAFLFVGWMILLTVQILLIRFKRYGIHRRLGLLLMGWAAAMVVVGPLTAWIMQRLEFGTPDSDPSFMAIQFGDMIVFGTVMACALIWRRRPSAHKRLILLATLAIGNAGFGRWLYADLHRLLGDGVIQNWVCFDGGGAVLIALLGLYDLVTRRRLHPAYVAATAWIFAMEWLMFWLDANPAWQAFTRHILSH